MAALAARTAVVSDVETTVQRGDEGGAAVVARVHEVQVRVLGRKGASAPSVLGKV